MAFPDEAVLCPPVFLGFLRSELSPLGVQMHEQQEVLGTHEKEQGVALDVTNGTTWQGD